MCLRAVLEEMGLLYSRVAGRCWLDAGRGACWGDFLKGAAARRLAAMEENPTRTAVEIQGDAANAFSAFCFVQVQTGVFGRVHLL